MLDLKEFICDFKRIQVLLEISPPWEIMDRISEFVSQNNNSGNGNYISPKAMIHKSSIISNSYVANGVKLYEYVNIRNSIILEDVTIGHCSEVNNSVIMNNCSIPRFNYIGWSIIGANVRFGGCVSLASRRFDDNHVLIKFKDKDYNTSRFKFGSIVGDDCLIGFSVHCNPGTVIGPRCVILPQCELRGYIPEDYIVSVNQQLIMSRKRDLTALGLGNVHKA